MTLLKFCPGDCLGHETCLAHAAGTVACEHADEAAQVDRRCADAVPGAATQSASSSHRKLQHREDGLLELGALWYWPLPRLLQLITEVHGWDQLIRAAEPGHGVIVTVPHFGSWELASLYLAQHLADTALLYKPLSELRVEQMISGYRARAGAQVLPANRSGIAAMIRLLQRGGYGGILPDQTPPAQAGQVAMLFGRPALSMTLLLRLARKTGASVVFVGCRRLPDRTHFVHIPASDTGLDTLLPGVAGSFSVAGFGMQLAQQFPGRGVIGIQLQGILCMFDGVY
jgi:lauroyl/myristoyl acyltransferase